MKKATFSIFFILLFFNVTCFAASDKINLYAEPSLVSNVINQYPPNQKQLYPFYHPESHPDWVKVGDTKTGLVCWVNGTQRREALEVYRSMLDNTIAALEASPNYPDTLDNQPTYVTHHKRFSYDGMLNADQRPVVIIVR